MTAVIGDVASYFGCTLGIKDSVTAVAFVALGTSIPGELSEPSSEIFSGREGEGGPLIFFFCFNAYFHEFSTRRNPNERDKITLSL